MHRTAVSKSGGDVAPDVEIVSLEEPERLMTGTNFEVTIQGEDN